MLEWTQNEVFILTTKIAITGKSGSGKTTITRAFLSVLKEKFPEKSILLFDNDLAGELGHTFGMDIRNTIYGIRSGKHEYRTGIPQQMTKQEYVEWAIEDIVIPNANLKITVAVEPKVEEVKPDNTTTEDKTENKTEVKE